MLCVMFMFCEVGRVGPEARAVDMITFGPLHAILSIRWQLKHLENYMGSVDRILSILLHTRDL